MTAAYLRILIHNMNDSLFPDADPSSTTWAGAPPDIVTVQSLLYASLATSLFAAFLAMLGKQWVNRYLRNRGGSAADKCRDRQRKLDGFEKWHFHLVIESLPVMLQLALVLLGCALSRYLWAISRTVAGVIVTVTLFGVTLYFSLSLAATLYYNCPYQTPLSILTWRMLRYIIHSDAIFALSLRSLVTPLHYLKKLKRLFWHLYSGAHAVLRSFGCIQTIAGGVEHIPLAATITSPSWIFESVSIDWEVCEADAHCVSWVLGSTTDPDVIYSTVQFAADMIWYPEIARALSPDILVNLFLNCLSDGQVIPGKSEHASSIGMALASVLSIHLCMEPKNYALIGLCQYIHDWKYIQRLLPSNPMFMPVVGILRFVADRPTLESDPPTVAWELLESIPYYSSITQRLWLSRIILQTLWRWRYVYGFGRVISLSAVGQICKAFTMANGQTPTILKTNLFLIAAISLGLHVNVHDLYAPNNRYVVLQFYHGFHS